MDTQRLILLFIFGFSVLMLWEAWQKETRPKPVPDRPTAQEGVPPPQQAPGTAPKTGTPATTGKLAAPPVAVPGDAAAPAKGETVRVRTDLIAAEIDTQGGTLKRLELLKHKDSADPNRSFVLFGPEHQYEAQSGLTGDSGPNHRTLWRSHSLEYALDARNDAIKGRLSSPGRDGVSVDKIYPFPPAGHSIPSSLHVPNHGPAPV